MSIFRKKNNSTSDKKTNSKNNSQPKKDTTEGKRRAVAMKAATRSLDSSEVKKTAPTQAIPELQAQQPVQQEIKPHYYESPKRDLPENYGDNQIYLMVRDPYWMYTYWEIQDDHQRNNLAKLGGSWDEVKSVLRVYDISDNAKQPTFFDIVLGGMANTWYIQGQPNHSYFIEIGLLHRDGRFIVLARSNTVTTPRSGMSEVIDEQWMGIDFDKMYALSGGFEMGKSSMELKKLMEERLMGAITSGSGAGMLSSVGSVVKKVKKRGFWFVVDCEVIIYGATEPNAYVTLQGRPVKLRPDGTFSARFAFPDGKIVLDARALSADGVEERTIIPIVERRTERPDPVFKKEFKGE